MNSWQNFLTQQGAQWIEDQLVGFAEAQSSTTIEQSKIPLSNHAILLIEGPDAQKFLQGQTTCDFNSLDQKHFVLGAHCNAQGRMLSSFWALQLAPQRYALRMPRSNLVNAQAALKKYIVFSKAEIQVSPWQGFASLPKVAHNSGGNLEKQTVETLTDAVALHYPNGAVEYWGESEALSQLWREDSALTALPPQAYNAWQVRNGIAEVELATSGEYIPQQFNFQLLEGISFKKGCYTGQEIIARIHYRGQVKKSVLRAEVTGFPQRLEIGARVFTREKHKEVATVINAAPLGNKQEVLLCANSEIKTQIAPFELQNEPVNFTWQGLPYAIPNE